MQVNETIDGMITQYAPKNRVYPRTNSFEASYGGHNVANGNKLPTKKIKF